MIFFYVVSFFSIDGPEVQLSKVRIEMEYFERQNKFHNDKKKDLKQFETKFERFLSKCIKWDIILRSNLKDSSSILW